MAAKEELLQDIDWLKREYLVRKRAVSQVAAKLHCPRQAVVDALEAAGIPVRLPTPRAVPTGPVDLTPAMSHEVVAPRAGCRCERPLIGDEGLCLKCGR